MSPALMQPGRFISFEGPEGSGKSTQIERLVARLHTAGREVVVTREPGGTAIGEEIRHLLMHSAKGHGMSAETELLLFTASRAQLVRELIAPALAAGKVVICDRFLDSTTAYQGAARRLAPAEVAAVNGFAVGGVLPHLTLVLDVPPEVSLARIAQRRGAAPDRMESEGLDFYRRVRDGYVRLARAESPRCVLLDGTRPADEIEADIWRIAHERLA